MPLSRITPTRTRKSSGLHPRASSRCPITIERSGTIVANLSPSTQCGGEGQLAFPFTIKITVGTLDSKGFVCDNRHIQSSINDYFSEGVWVASCEELACTCITLAYQLCKGRALNISCTIRPFHEVAISVDWCKGQPLPLSVATLSKEPSNG